MPIILIFISCFSLSSQTGLNDFLKPSDTLNKSRRNAVVITEASLASLTLIGLDQLWYNDFQRSKFRTINDNNEWLLMDKMGHVMASYYVGRVGANVLDWSGVREKDQLIYGATIGLGFLTAVEVFDGFSEEWGFSWGDMLANASGTGLYIGQELLWQEQRITMKYS
ncbi:MAG: YfiM family protein, partial [Bacteroidia bacterium]|nr:YfiM family protein [Bacteroidia bacterium]